MKTISKAWKAIKWVAVAILGVYAIYAKYRWNQKIEDYKKSVDIAVRGKVRAESLMKTIERYKDNIPKYEYDWQINANEVFMEYYNVWMND